MTTIKFDKSVKYQGVRYAAHEAFKVADEDVEDLKKAGAIVLATEAVSSPEKDEEQPEVEADEHEEQESNEDVAQLKEKLLEYTVPELIKFAEERGIDLQKKTKKAEIYNIIVAALN
jgi:hypothetical protein